MLTDIQGLEDFLGDMDFKVAGTQNGITAIQMDIKIKGISEEIMHTAIEQANEGRQFILSKMLNRKRSPSRKNRWTKEYRLRRGSRKGNLLRKGSRGSARVPPKRRDRFHVCRDFLTPFYEQVEKETLEHFAEVYPENTREIKDSIYYLNKEKIRAKILGLPALGTISFSINSQIFLIS